MIHATLVEVPRQRNTREENADTKSGKQPEQWDQNRAKFGQKDMDARWTRKNNEKYYGYKKHVNDDQVMHKLDILENLGLSK